MNKKDKTSKAKDPKVQQRVHMITAGTTRIATIFVRRLLLLSVAQGSISLAVRKGQGF